MSSISYESDGPVATITISRPERRNALDHRALVELHDAVRRAGEDNLRALVLTGDAGHFCAGADLTELEDLRFTEHLRSALDELASLPLPTIAAISGACMGLGMQLALAVDLRIATPEARFAVPVAKLGLMVDHWTIRRLSLCVGHSTARWMLLTAEALDTEAMAACGFVQRVVPVGSGGAPGSASDPGAAVLAEAHRLAAGISDLAPLSLAGSKLGFDLLADGALPGTDVVRSGDVAQPGAEPVRSGEVEGSGEVAGSGEVGGSGDAERSGDADAGRPVHPVDPYRKAFEKAWASEDLMEGRHAFRERRAPDFRGR